MSRWKLPRNLRQHAAGVAQAMDDEILHALNDVGRYPAAENAIEKRIKLGGREDGVDQIYSGLRNTAARWRDFLENG